MVDAASELLTISEPSEEAFIGILRFGSGELKRVYINALVRADLFQCLR